MEGRKEGREGGKEGGRKTGRKKLAANSIRLPIFSFTSQMREQ